jgi:hypothetical protein
MVETAPPPLQGAGATTLDNYAKYYRNTDWNELRVNPAYVIREFGSSKTGQQLYEDIRATSNDTPHAYITLMKDESQLVLLHHASYHATPLGTTAEPWNSKVLIFT